MDEILATIRRIIADDERSSSAGTRGVPAGVAPVAVSSPGASSPAVSPLGVSKERAAKDRARRHRLPRSWRARTMFLI